MDWSKPKYFPPRSLESVVDEGLEQRISDKQEKIFVFFMDGDNVGTESEFEHKLEKKYELFCTDTEFCSIEKNKLIDGQYVINREDIEFEYGNIKCDYDFCLFRGSMVILDHYFKEKDKYQTQCWCFEYHRRDV